MNKSMNKRNVLRLLAWTGLAAVAGTGLAACTDRKPSFNAVDITGADYAKGFTLADADGRQRTLADFKGKAVVMFFGYAQCPDVCSSWAATATSCKCSSSPSIQSATRPP